MSGNYPFTLFIENTFKKESGVKLNVRYHRHNYGIENSPLTNYDFTISPGCRIGFPLYWADEFVKLSTPKNLSDHLDKYFIWIGKNCKIPAFDSLNDSKQVYRNYWKWEFNKSKKAEGWEEWSMRIQKMTPDPEDDDVTIGEDPPG